MGEQRQEITGGQSAGAASIVDVSLGENATDSQPKLLVEVYKAYLEDSHQLRAERQANDSLRVTIVTLFLGAEAYVANLALVGPKPDVLASLALPAWIPIIVSTLVGITGMIFCLNWRRLSEDQKKTLGFKYSRLLKMEQEYAAYLRPVGATLFTNEDTERKEAKKLRPFGFGAWRNTQRLQDFFLMLFIVLIIGAPIIKLIVALSYGASLVLGPLRLP